MVNNIFRNKKIAIIGASTGQIPICKKAKSLGLETYCFAWEEGAICKDIVDHFAQFRFLRRTKLQIIVFAKELMVLFPMLLKELLKRLLLLQKKLT